MSFLSRSTMCLLPCILVGVILLSIAVISCAQTDRTGIAETNSGGQIYISEVAIHGFEFVELYNSTSETLPLDGWTLCYYSANREAWSDYVNIRPFPAGATIDSQAYFLAGLDYTEGSNYPETVDWITEPRIRLSDASGCVAVFSGTPSDENLVDAVGWGDTALGEGNPVQLVDTGLTLNRIHGSTEQTLLVDSDNNDRDFVLRLPTPCTSQVAVHAFVESSPGERNLDTLACWEVSVTSLGGTTIDCTFDAWGDLALAAEVVPGTCTLEPGEQIELVVSADLSEGLSFYALDLETTGFSPSDDEITEIAWARFESGRIVQTYSTLVRPREQITSAKLAFACEWLGVTEDELQGAPPLGEILPAVLSDLDGQLVVVHSGNAFDQRFLQRWSETTGTSIPVIRWVDTMTVSRNVYSELDSHTLGFLASEFDLPLPTHRALSDAVAAGCLYWEILREQGVYVRIGITAEGHNENAAIVELEVPIQ